MICTCQRPVGVMSRLCNPKSMLQKTKVLSQVPCQLSHGQLYANMHAF